MSTPHLRGAARAALLALVLAASAWPAHAQQLLRGRVVLDGAPVAGVPVTLHQVTPDSSGPVGSASSRPDGSFTLAVPPADTSGGFSVFFATAEFRGVRYFGPPLHPGDAGTGYAVEVFDTASASRAPGAVQVARRDVIVLPEEDGSAEVNEIVRIRNSSKTALVVGSGASTWEFRLPAGVVAFEVGDGQIAPDAVVRKGERVLVTATIPPGEQELFVRYRLARGTTRTRLPVTAATDSMSLFVRQPAPATVVEGLAAPVAVQAEGDSFLRYNGGGLDPRSAVVMEWDNPGAPPVDPRAAAVGATALVLAAGAGLAFRRRPRPA